jgi:peptide/nickel transport system permease protein
VINGAQTALLTALIALLVSFGLGGLLGGIAGYLGDDRFKVTVASLVMAPILIGTSLFLLLASRKSQLGLLGWGDVFTVIAASLLLYGGLSWLFRKLNWGQQSLTLPLDTAIMRFAEIMESVPGLIAVLVCVSFLESRTLSKVIVIIGLLSWTGVARFLRAELLKVRQMPYITAVRRLGLPEWRILWRHAVPNALRPVLLLLALSASGAILLESSLSFLNLSSETITDVTWGKMLQGSRDNIEYWWVWLPPGVMITLVSAAMFEVMD